MPIYEYACPAGHRHEEISSEIKSWSKCPVCGKRAKHILSPPAIHFHGPGFHNTDYKKNQPQKAAKSKKNKN